MNCGSATCDSCNPGNDRHWERRHDELEATVCKVLDILEKAKALTSVKEKDEAITKAIQLCDSAV